jgi:hypothetical protein
MLAYVLALAVGLGSLAIYLAAFFFPEIHRKGDFVWSGVGMFYALVLWVFARRISGGLLLGHVASVALLSWSVSQTLLLRRQLTPQTQQTPIPSTEAVTSKIQEQVSPDSLQEKASQAKLSFGSVFSNLKGKVQEIFSKKPTDKLPTAKSVVEILDERTSIPETQTENTEGSVLEVVDAPVGDLDVDAVTPIPEPSQVESTPGEELEIVDTQDVNIITDAPESVTETVEDVPELIPPNPPPVELVEAAQAIQEESHPSIESLPEETKQEVAQPHSPNTTDK